MYQVFSLGLLIAFVLPVEAQTAISTTVTNTGEINTAKQQVLQVLNILRNRVGAIGEAGSPTTAEVERVLADDYLSIDEAGQPATRAETLQKCCSPEAAAFWKKLLLEAQLKVQIKDVNVKVHGNTAVAHYKIEGRLVINKDPVVKTFNSTEVLVKRDSRWQSVMHTETVIPAEIVFRPRAINSKVYDDYVGKYRLTSSVDYTVTRVGDRLLWGRDHTELVPESETTFVRTGHFPDVLYRIIFVRNDEGRVTHLLVREFPGVEYPAIKIQ